MTIVFLCIAGFIASLVDSIAGGGGLISVPAFIMAGLSPHNVLGTNKFCATAGSITSSMKFAKSGKVNFKLIKYLIPFTFLGASLGVIVVGYIPSDFLKSIVLVLILIIGIYTTFSKTLGIEDTGKVITKTTMFSGVIFAFVLGFYDGFFGPGTGSFLIFGFIKIFGFDFTKATGNAKFLNFISNLSSLVLFAIKGQILYVMGIPVAICMIIGARIGTKLAIENGARFIKPIYIVMSLAVAAKLITSYIF